MKRKEFDVDENGQAGSNIEIFKLKKRGRERKNAPTRVIV